MKIECEISKDRERELQSLKQSSGLKTDEELFNNALSILDWAVQEVQKGHIIASVDEAGKTYTELRMQVLKHVASAEAPTSPSANSVSFPVPAL
jgi:hypothetical protein